MHPTEQLRGLLRERHNLPLIVPGAVNALSARVVEEAGFAACYVSGAGVTNSYLGVPDHGLLSVTELTDHVAAMADAVAIPLIVDADTGFGNAINVSRTVRQLERAGAAAIQLEDQLAPKKCGHFSGKEVISTAEMVGKIRAACDARTDDALMVVARTDARAGEGIEAACDRAAAYAEAGADVLFVEAPRTIEEMRQVTTTVPGLHIANMVEGGLTPLLTRDQLAELGFAIGLYANAAMRGAVLGMRAVMEHLAKHGDTLNANDLMISWTDRQNLVRKPAYDELESRYARFTDEAEAGEGE
ncbi:MAG: isocitrate lyase/PEP mutase family protein [Nocardioidaceae bacterium]